MTDNRGNQSRAVGPFQQFTEQWSRASRHALNSSVGLLYSAMEANRAFMVSLEGPTPEDGNRTAAVPIDGMAYNDVDWSFERSVDTFDELDVGEWVSFTKRLSDEDVHDFARISGDTNRLHLDDDFADQTRFGGRIVHGTLLSGLISAALARLPGLTIYLSQDLEFRRPVEIGATVTADCEILEDLGGGKYRLDTRVTADGDEPVIEGEAIVLIDELPNTENPE